LSILRSNQNKNQRGLRNFSITKTLFLSFFIAVIAPVLLVDDATAQNAACSSLRSQLAAIGVSGKRSKKPLKQYNRAILTQQRQLSSVRGKLSTLGCRSKRKIFVRSVNSQCSPLRKKRRRMERNLASLKSKARRKSEGSNSARVGYSSRLRRKLKRKLRIARCFSGNGQVNGIVTEQRARDLRIRKNKLAAEKLRNSRERQDQIRKAQRNNGNEAGIEQMLLKKGTYKTMCVRTCDGYYFPVSFSTTPDAFVGDSQACNQLCPGVAIQLFIQNISDTDPQNMISVGAGKPYSKLRNAFSFKKSFNPSCRCNYNLLQPEILSTEILSEAKKKPLINVTQAVSRPVTRPDKGQDPETLMNDNLTVEINKLNVELKPRQVIKRRKVRIVGEAHFPDQ